MKAATLRGVVAREEYCCCTTLLTLHLQQTPQRHPPWGGSLGHGHAFPTNKNHILQIKNQSASDEAVNILQIQY